MTVIAIASLSFSSCKKSSSSSPASTSGSSGSMTAKINGISFAAAKDSAVAALLNGEINISGIASDGKTITITLMDTIGGTYDLSATGDGAAAYKVNASATTSYTSNSGPSTASTITLTIDKTKKTMTGTFSFKGYAFNGSSFDSVSVTNGQFTNVPYSTSINSTGNNSFAVTIDGTPFTPAIIAGNLFSGMISITASDNTGSKSVGIDVPSTVTPGTYTFDGGTYIGQYNPNSSNFYSANQSGSSLVITQNDVTNKKIVGTFHFTAAPFSGTGTANLTNGSFTIYYQ